MTTKAESLGLRNPNNIVFSEYVPAIKMVRVPCNLLGMVLDQGRGSIYAAHLLAIKCSKGPGFVLNEQHVAGVYGIGRKTFQAGIRILKRCEVMARKQTGRAFAVENLAEPSRNFVSVSETLLQAKSAEIAFVLAVNLSPVPVRPADAAKRIGIKDRGTVRRMVGVAIEHACASNEATAPIPILLARCGYNFELVKNGPAKNGPAKNRPAHSNCKKGTEYGRGAQKSEKQLPYRTRNPDGFSGTDDTEDFAVPAKGKTELGPEWIVLKDWRTSMFWRDRCDASSSDKEEEGCSLEAWRRCLAWCGGAPGHVATPHAHRQVLEISHELTALLDLNGEIAVAMQALAFWICRAHAAGKTIRSLAFIAEELARRCDEGDDTWLYDIPPCIPAAEFESAAKLAKQAADALRSYGIAIDRRSLLSTQRVEMLACMIRQHTHGGVVAGINHATENGLKPDEGRRISGWSWFDDKIVAAVAPPKTGRRRKESAA